jgi:hypothetical protein
MYNLSLSDILSSNRNSLVSLSIALVLYNISNKFDIYKKNILKNIAKLLLLYSLINIILFNIIGLINNNNFTKIYCIITIIIVIIILNYIYITL